MKAKRSLIATVALLLTTSPLLAADAKDEVGAAIGKLQSNYSWTALVESAMGQSKGEGKTVKDGVVWLSVTFGENTIEAYIKSADKAAIKAQDQDWKSLAELTSDANQGPGRWLGRMIQNYRAPAAEATNVLAKIKNLKKDGEAYSGELTEAGAKELLPFGGRRGGNSPETKDAKGSVKFWTKAGILAKYELKLDGKITVNGEDRDAGRTMSVEFKDVGSTKVQIPEGAQKKLQ